jgi:hypothetical protein
VSAAATPGPHAIRIARVYLAVAALLIVVGAITGGVMQAELWGPDIATSGELYARMLGAHGLALSSVFAAPALAGMLGYVVVTHLLDVRTLPARAVAWVGLAVWAAGLVVGIAALLEPPGFSFPPDDREYLLSVTLANAAGVITTMHLAGVLVANARRARASGAIVAAVVVSAAGVACIVELVDVAQAWPFAAARDDGGLVVGFTWIAALALATATLLAAGTRAPPWPLVLAGLAGVGWWALADGAAGTAPAVVMWGWLLGGGAWRRPAAVYVALGIVPVLIAITVVNRLVRAADDLHLHDTYVTVGHYHLLAIGVGCATLAALHAWSGALFGRIPHAWLARAGGVVLCIGLMTHAIAMIVVGFRGMPRRYVAYIPELVTPHRIAAVGAIIGLAGAITIVIAWVRSHRRVHSAR